MPAGSRRRRTAGLRGQESTGIGTASRAPLATPSLSTQPPISPSSSAGAGERAGSSHSLIESRNLVITDGQFNQIRGHHTNLVINLNQSTSGSPPGSPSTSPPLNETDHTNPVPSSGRNTQPNYERFHVPSQSQDIPLQKSNDIYERHLTLKGRGFPLWIPEPNQVLDLSYRRTGVRIGDVGIITHSGGFSFLFNICLPRGDPVNPRVLPEHFAPISPPIEAIDIEKFLVFKNGSHLASASIKRSQTSAATSGIVFESSASEGAILTMPRGARSEDLGNFARFRDYAAANAADWYKFVNGPRGREAKNGDVRLIVGFDKTTAWGIATFANHAQQNNCRLRFCSSEGSGLTASASTYAWEYSGVAEVRAGPDSDENDELRRVSDPPDLRFENQCLFVRTLNVTLADHDWADIHSSLGSIHVDPRSSQYPRVKDYANSNGPHSSNSATSGGSNLSPSRGTQYGTQRTAGSLYGSQDVGVTSDDNPSIFISGPLESLTAHPSKVLNDTLLAKIPTAKMVITHDDDWSFFITQYDTFPEPHELIANILASRNVCEENGVVFLQPKEIPNEILEGSASINNQTPEVVMADLTKTETPSIKTRRNRDAPSPNLNSRTFAVTPTRVSLVQTPIRGLVNDELRLNVNRSVTSSMSETTVTAPVSGILDGSNPFSSRTMAAGLASGISSLSHTGGSLLSEDLARKRCMEPTSEKYGREPSGSEPVMSDLSRCAEVTDGVSSKGYTAAPTIPDNNKGKAKSREPGGHALRKGKWPEDFMDAIQSQPIPTRHLLLDHDDSSARQFTPISTSPPRKKAVVGATAVRHGSDVPQAPISPLPRRLALRPKHRIDASPITMPKDPDSGRHGTKPSASRNSGVLIPRSSNNTSTSTNNTKNLSSYSKDDWSLVSSRTASASGTPSPPHHSSAIAGAGETLQSERPCVLRGFHSDTESSSSLKKRAGPTSSRDGLGAKPTRPRFESMVNLRVESGTASASDLISREPLGGSAVRMRLVVREHGKPQTHFQLGNCIGRGQFGSVYRALNLNSGQMVAVKRIQLKGLKEDEVITLMRAVDLAKSLSHPNIIKYEGMVRDENTLNIVLEYAENGSLGQTLKAFGKLTERLVASYVVKILEGLHYLHSSNVVHGDLKAANILITRNGDVKLSDFRVSFNLRAMEGEIKDVTGTPNWMAPEVIELKGASTKSDIWSLGCTVIELLTGRPPYAEMTNSMSVMFRIVEDDMPLPEGCSELLRNFFEKCFRKDPARRPSAGLLCVHIWLKKDWVGLKDPRPQDSTRRVGTDSQKLDVFRYPSRLDSSPISPKQKESAGKILPTGRRVASKSSTRPLHNDVFPSQHSFTKTTFGKRQMAIELARKIIQENLESMEKNRSGSPTSSVTESMDSSDTRPSSLFSHTSSLSSRSSVSSLPNSSSDPKLDLKAALASLNTLGSTLQVVTSTSVKKHSTIGPCGITVFKKRQAAIELARKVIRENLESVENMNSKAQMNDLLAVSCGSFVDSSNSGVVNPALSTVREEDEELESAAGGEGGG